MHLSYLPIRQTPFAIRCGLLYLSHVPGYRPLSLFSLTLLLFLFATSNAIVVSYLLRNPCDDHTGTLSLSPTTYLSSTNTITTCPPASSVTTVQLDKRTAGSQHLTRWEKADLLA
jgi:hypothetical protein